MDMAVLDHEVHHPSYGSCHVGSVVEDLTLIGGDIAWPAVRPDCATGTLTAGGGVTVDLAQFHQEVHTSPLDTAQRLDGKGRTSIMYPSQAQDEYKGGVATPHAASGHSLWEG